MTSHSHAGLPAHGGDVHSLARRLGRPLEEILDFSASINPLGPPPELPRRLAEDMGLLLRHYPSPRSAELTGRLAARLGLEPGRLMMGNGSTELIHLLPRLRERGRALFIAPFFGEYAAAVDAAGWSRDWLAGRPDDGFVPDGEALAARLAEGYDLVFMANPTNPGGALMPGELIVDLAEAQARRGGLLVLDEAFIDFAPGSSCVGLLGDLPGLAILGSLTKFYALPGLRLGFLAGRADLVAELTRFQPPWSVNALSQAAGLICLEAADHVDRTHVLMAAERPRFSAALAGLGLRVYPGAANYLLARLDGGGRSAEDVCRALAEKGILARNCDNYLGLEPGHLRFSVRLPRENDRLLDALAGILGRR